MVRIHGCEIQQEGNGKDKPLAKTIADEWFDCFLDGGRTLDDRYLEAVRTFDYYMDDRLEGELVVYGDGSVMKLNEHEHETGSMREFEEWFDGLVEGGDISNYKLTDTTSKTLRISESIEHINKMLHLGEDDAEQGEGN